MHYRIDELFLASFRILLHEGHNLDAGIVRAIGLEGFDNLGNMLYRLGLVVFDGYRGLVDSKSLLDQGGPDNHLLAFLQQRTEIGGEIRLALASVDDQHLTLLPGRRAKLDMGRESGTAQSDDSAELYLLYNRLRIVRDGSDEVIGTVDVLHPFVTFDSDFHADLVVSRKVLAGADRLDGSGNGRMDESRHETTGLCNHLAGLDLVTDGDHRLGRSSNVLGHSDIDSRRDGKDFQLAIAGYLGIRRMHSSD